MKPKFPAWLWQWAACFLLSAVWLSPLIPDPSAFPIWRGSPFSDLVITHWPNALFLRRSIAEWGQIPLWNPMILSGAPFFADPLSGLWYPPLWLAALLPCAATFNVLFWIHLAWGAWGAWRFLRAKRWQAGLVAAVGFGGMPKLVGHIGLGHLGLVCAVSWTPWVLASVSEAASVGLGKPWSRFAKRWALAGGLLGIVFLADPRWLFPTSLLAVAIAARATAHSQPGSGRTKGFIGGLVICGLFLVTIAAFAWVPFAEFVQETTRWTMSRGESAALSLPPAHMLGLLIPDFGGWPEWMAYPGIVVVCLSLSALLSRAPGSLFWGGVGLVSLLLSLGSHTPLHGAFAALIPGGWLVRVPARWLFVAGLAFAYLAGIGMDAALCGLLHGAVAKRQRLLLGGLGAFLVLFGFGLRLVGGDRQLSLASAGAGVLALATTFVLVGVQSRRTSAHRLGVVVVALAVADLAVINTTLLGPLPVATVSDEGSGIAEWLTSQPGLGRVFSPSYSLPQQQAALAGLELADGVNPLQIAAYRDFMARATGFDPRAYSVTLPPFPEGDPSRDWSPFLSGEALGRLSISHVVSAYPLQGSDLELEEQVEGAFVYRNTSYRPRALILEQDDHGNGPWREVDRIERSPNKLVVHADGPGTLVLSEILYPGWAAEVDGKPVPIEPASSLLRGVALPDGAHTIVLSYGPKSVVAGLWISALGVVALVALWLRK